MAVPVKNKYLKNNINIRRASRSDIKAINQLVKRAFADYNKKGKNPVKEEKPEDIVRDIMENIVLVIEKDKEIIGTLRLEKEAKDSFYLKRFSIDPDHQDQGLGTKLYLEAEKTAVKEDISYIFLYSSIENEGLIKFYKRLGFVCLKTDEDNGYQRGLWIKNIVS